MAVGFPAKTTYANGDVFSASDINDTNGTINLINPSAKGDLFAGSAANTYTKLSVGTNGQVLTAASGQATGLQWTTIAGWSPNYQLLNSGGTTLSGTTTTVSGISGINALFIWIDAASMNSTGYITFQFNSDSGANYGYFGNYVTPAGVASQAGTSGATAIRFSYIGNAAGVMNGYIKVDGTGTSGIKTVEVGSRANNTNGEAHTTLGTYTGTSAISSISIIGDGTFDAGKVYVYGA